MGLPVSGASAFRADSEEFVPTLSQAGWQVTPGEAVGEGGKEAKLTPTGWSHGLSG